MRDVCAVVRVVSWSVSASSFAEGCPGAPAPLDEGVGEAVSDRVLVAESEWRGLGREGGCSESESGEACVDLLSPGGDWGSAVVDERRVLRVVEDRLLMRVL